MGYNATQTCDLKILSIPRCQHRRNNNLYSDYQTSTNIGPLHFFLLASCAWELYQEKNSAWPQGECTWRSNTERNAAFGTPAALRLEVQLPNSVRELFHGNCPLNSKFGILFCIFPHCTALPYHLYTIYVLKQQNTLQRTELKSTWLGDSVTKCAGRKMKGKRPFPKAQLCGCDHSSSMPLSSAK